MISMMFAISISYVVSSENIIERREKDVKHRKAERLFLLCVTVCDRMEKQGRRDTGSR